MNRRKFFRRLGAVAVGSAVAPAVVIKALSPIVTKYQMGVDVGLGRDIAITTIYPRSTPFLDSLDGKLIKGKFEWYDQWTDEELIEIKKLGPGSHKK